MSKEEVKEKKNEEDKEEEEDKNEPKSLNRQVHIIRGVNQIVIATEDPKEHIEFLLDKAMFVIDEIKSEDSH